MSSLLGYKGYTARVEFDAGDRIFLWACRRNRQAMIKM